MTGTKMKYEITMAFSDYVPNRTLGPWWTSACGSWVLRVD